MIETILRRVIVVAAFLVLFVPFIVAESSYFPYIVGKAVLFRVLVECMLGAWIALALINQTYRPRWSPVLIASGIFLVVVGLADAFGVNPMRSFWSNFERMEGFITIFHVVAYLFVMASVFRSEKFWTRFWNLSVVASVLISFHAFSQINPTYPGELVRVAGTLGNAIYLAVYLLLNIFITLLLAYRARANKLFLILYGCAAVVQLCALYYTGTRGAFVGLVVGIGFATIATFIGGSKEHASMRRVAGGLLVFGIIAIGLFIVMRNTAFIQQTPILARVANISLADTTVESRVTLWTKIAWNTFLERPLLGWGQDNFIVAFGKHYDPLMYKQEPWFDRAHNVFVDWAVAGGVLGLLAYLGLFVASLWMLWRSSVSLPEKALLTGLLAAYATNNMFVFDNLVSYIYFAAVLAYIHTRQETSDGGVPSRLVERSSLMQNGALCCAVVVVVVLAWFTVIRPGLRAQTLLEALRADYATYDAERTLALYEKALAYGPITGFEEVREQLSQSAIRLVNNESATPEARTAIIVRAFEELSLSATDEPDNTRRLYFLAHMLKETGQLSEARVVFEQALAINPLRQNFLYELGETYLSEDNFDMFIDIMKRAYEAERENNTAFGYYSGALMFAGRIAEGEALLVERFGTTTVDNKYVLQAYTDVGASEKVAAILELRLQKMAPADDPSARVSLAMVYLELGRRDDAVAQLERAAELRPDFADQAGQMIKAIKEGKNIKIK